MRMALGAQRSRVLNLVLKEGAIPAAIGSAIGLGGAISSGGPCSRLYSASRRSMCGPSQWSPWYCCLLPCWRAFPAWRQPRRTNGSIAL